MTISTQLSLHTRDFLRHRQQLVQQLMQIPTRHINHDGKVKLVGDVIAEVVADTEAGQRFVWQSTLDTRVQL